MKLKFRQTGLNNEGRSRLLLLSIIFILALIFFEFLLNYKSNEATTDMDSPTLPTITMEAYNHSISELHGYVVEMDALYMRDAVVPLDESRTLPITIHTNGRAIDSISYEIRSTDTERKIAETEVSDYLLVDDDITADLSIENLVNEDEEFLFIITLTSGGQEIYYYTRILMPTSAYASDCLDFAIDFHNKALSGDQNSLAAYMETDAEADGEDLQHVTITSSVSQMCYGSFDGQIVGEPVIEFKDINSNYTALVLYYQMERSTSAGTEYYLVEEYFKIRYTAERIYLLDYERTMDQMLTGENATISDNVMNIGIASSDLEYLSNETGTIIAFVQAGELFEYNQSTQVLTKVFSFVGDSANDSRATYDEHNILLLNIDETGTLDFVVYGYMNCGEYEGQCGINLYHYDSSTNKAHEQTFIRTTNSYQILNASFSDVLYESTDSIFYIMVDGTLMRIDLDNLTTEELLTGLTEDQYAASISGRYFAWIDEEAAGSSLHVMDLEDGSKEDIEATSSSLLIPLAFIDEDLIYGTVLKKDITTDAAGSGIYPMYQLTIENASTHNVVKTYEKSGYYVSNVTLDGYTLYLDRVQKQADGTVIEAEPDTIKNSAGEANKTVDVAAISDDIKGKVITFTMADLTSDEEIHHFTYTTAGLVLNDASSIISVKATETTQNYFVYVGNRVAYAGSDLVRAITYADEEMGIVVDNTQQYIWKRGKGSYKGTLSNLLVGAADTQESSQAQCISVMLVREGENVEVHTLLERNEKPIDILSSAMKDATVLDLTGCSLSEVLYYVYLGNPVYAIGSDGEALLIVGYDAANITLYNPVTGATYKKGLQDSTEEFESAGNIFISYIN